MSSHLVPAKLPGTKRLFSAGRWYRPVLNCQHPDSFQFLFLFYFIFSSHFLFFFYSHTITKSQPHELQSHISQVLYNYNYKSCTIKIDSRNKSCNHNQETSLSQSRNKFLQSQSRNNRKHNSSTIPPAAAPTSSAPLPHARAGPGGRASAPGGGGRAPRPAQGGRAPPHWEAARSAAGGPCSICVGGRRTPPASSC